MRHETERVPARKYGLGSTSAKILVGGALVVCGACVQVADIDKPALSEGGGGSGQAACSKDMDCPSFESTCIKSVCSNGYCDSYKDPAGTSCGPDASCDASGVCTPNVQTCPSTDNGVCNEPPPAGDGTCPLGSDAKDCMPVTCASAGDGTCDEPEGTGKCPEGSDPLDCPAAVCAKCLTYALNAQKDMLCNASAPLFASLFECACGTCAPSCSNVGDLCDFGSLSSTCVSCISSLCTTQYNACVQDG